MPSQWGVSGSPNVGNTRGKLATWNGDGTYGTPVIIPALQMHGVTAVVKNVELEGYQGIQDSYTNVSKGEGQLKFGSVSLAVISVLTGIPIATLNSTPNVINRIKLPVGQMAYFGITTFTPATNNKGGIQLFGPKCKITSNWLVAEGGYGAYTVPDMKFSLLPDDQYVQAGTNEVQTVTITGVPTGGTFTLSYLGQVTAPIAFGATASAVQSALQALSTIGSGNALVTGSGGGPYTVTFSGTLAQTYTSTLVGNGALLTGGTAPAVTVTVATPGVLAQPIWFDPIEYQTLPADIFLPPGV